MAVFIKVAFVSGKRPALARSYVFSLNGWEQSFVEFLWGWLDGSHLVL